MQATIPRNYLLTEAGTAVIFGSACRPQAAAIFTSEIISAAIPGMGIVKNVRIIYTCGVAHYILYSREYQTVRLPGLPVQ